jgi:hypothetical protein
MIFDVVGREDDEAAGWVLVDVMVGTGTAGVLAMVRRGARVDRVGREELGIGKTVEATAFKESEEVQEEKGGEKESSSSR